MARRNPGIETLNNHIINIICVILDKQNNYCHNFKIFFTGRFGIGTNLTISDPIDDVVNRRPVLFAIIELAVDGGV